MLYQFELFLSMIVYISHTFAHQSFKIFISDRLKIMVVLILPSLMTIVELFFMCL